MQLQRYQTIDPSYLLATVSGDWEIFRGLGQTFLETAPPIFHNIDVATAANDMDALRRESHSLKGMAAMVGAQALSDLLREVEVGAREGAPPNKEFSAKLSILFAQVLAEMTDCLQETAAPH